MLERKILIDNSTLSGVERILGHSQTLNLYNTENDILCFEKFVTSILFSEKIVAINDYKEEYRRRRIGNFGYVTFVDVSSDRYNSISLDAARFAKEMLFSFEGSVPAGDAAKFFDTLRISPQMRWDIFVSSEYLTLSMLVKQKKDTRHESIISAALGNELADKDAISPEHSGLPALATDDNLEIEDIKDLVGQFANSNPNYSGKGSGSTLEKMVFGYGWIAERSRFYSAMGSELDAEIALSPLRDAFCESCCRIDMPTQTVKLLEAIKDSAREAIVSILEPSGQARFGMKMPFFTTYLISKSENPLAAIDLALNIREQKRFRQCRDLLSNLSHLEGGERLKEVNRIFRFLNEELINLAEAYAIDTGQGASFSVSLGTSGIDISKDFKLGRLFREYKNRPFAKVFRSISDDMLNVERMGGLYEKMLRSRRNHKDAHYPRISTTPEFMRHKESDYGRPAVSSED